MKRKRRTLPEKTVQLGKEYANVLRDRASLMRTSFVVSQKVRRQIAADLEELARIAEKQPELFRG